MKIKMTKLALMTAIAGSLLSGSANAATLVLTPEFDSTIRVGVTNQSTSQILFVGDTTTAGDFMRTVLAYDLNHPLLDGATINSATLSMQARGPDSSSQSATVSVTLHELTASFTDTGVTWTSRDGINNWGAAGGDFGTALDTKSGNPETIGALGSLDFASAGFTNAVAAANGGSLNLLLKSASEDNTARNLFQFGSNENGNNSARAVLTIDYTPVPEPGSLALLGLGGLLIARRRRG